MSVSGSASLIPQSMFAFTVPIKDALNFNNQHLKESERRFKLINEISKSEEKKKIIVTIEEVEKAIQKLNSGKAADCYRYSSIVLR
jgi:hypothetical protein